MTSPLLATTAAAVLALAVTGSAAAGNTSSFTPLPADSASAPTYTYGVNGKKRTCTLTRGAKCVGAQLRGKVKHHGDLRGANLRRADLRFADLRGANLQGADLRSDNLKYADLRGANLKGAKFQYARPVRGKKAKRGNQTPSWTPSCAPYCQGAKLPGAVSNRATLT